VVLGTVRVTPEGIAPPPPPLVAVNVAPLAHEPAVAWKQKL
jgi:hypothetical protein